MSRDVRKLAFCICAKQSLRPKLRGETVKPLAIFCGCTALFVLDLVGNPEDQSSYIHVPCKLS